MAEKEDEKVNELEEMRYMQQVYQNQYAMLNNSVSMQVQEVQMLGAVQRTLESSDMLKGKETLMHVGGSVYMKTSVKDSGHAIVSVGAGYLVEKNIDEAKGYVSAMVAKKTELVNNLAKNRKELQAALIELSYKIESASR
jgi:prefoldin alpha subunit